MKKQSNAVRENWLNAATAIFRTEWKKRGIEVPADVKVTCGWPGGGSPRKRIGECFPRALSAAKVNEVFINPVLADSTLVADVLGHELLHAVDDCKSGHKAVFTRNSKAVGYSGGKHSAAATPEAKALLAAIIAKLGVYPHKEVRLPGRKQNLSKGLHKFVCEECGEDTLYSTAKMVAIHGAPTCRACGEEMQHADRQKRKVVETI